MIRNLWELAKSCRKALQMVAKSCKNYCEMLAKSCMFACNLLILCLIEKFSLSWNNGSNPELEKRHFLTVPDRSARLRRNLYEDGSIGVG